MAEYKKPLSVPDEDSIPFWEGCKSHQLVIQRCKDCRTYRFPPSPLCPNCLSMEAVWDKVSGEGKVYTYSIIYLPPSADWPKEELPMAIGIIELKEGIKMMSNIVGIDPKNVKVGMKVKVTFEDATDKITLPKFAPV